MNWADILKVGFSGFAFAVLFYSFILSKKGLLSKQFGWQGIILAVLVILSSYIDKIFESRDPETILSPCRAALETLNTQLDVVDQTLLREVTKSKITICEGAFDALKIS